MSKVKMIVDYTFIHGYSGRKMKRILIMVIKYIEGHHYNDVDEEMVKENAVVSLSVYQHYYTFHYTHVLHLDIYYFIKKTRIIHLDIIKIK